MTTTHHGALDAVLGRWQTRGRVLTDSAEILGTDTYLPGPGDRVLLHEVDVVVGEAAVQVWEWIVPDGESGWTAIAFDADGSISLMSLTIGEDGAWRFTGGGDVAPEARSAGDDTSVRATLRPAGASMSALWERLGSGGWEPWMEVSFTEPADPVPTLRGTGPSADAAPAMRALDVLTGEWTWTGSGDEGFAVDGWTRLDWLPGGRLLREVGDLTSAGRTSHTLAVVGWDEDDQTCRATYVDDTGEVQHYRIGVEGDELWIAWDALRFRGPITRDRISGSWQRRTEAGWRPWYEAVLTRS